MIQAAQVMEGDADLEDTLIQAPDVAPFGAPQQFERLVLLEVLAAVELRNPLEELRRRRLVTPVVHAGMLS
jgi:hypothetical protein